MDHKISLVIDVNVWISFLIGKGIQKRFEKILLDPRFQIYLSQELIEEFIRVSSYSKLQKYISIELAKRFALALQDDFVLIDLQSEMKNLSSDPKDDYLLNLCEKIQADYLITGDKPHLLSLKNYKITEIIQLSDFCKKFRI